ncbi:MAG: hypothetical protein ABWZ25_14680 [Chitinophagaceae bacterium]
MKSRLTNFVLLCMMASLVSCSVFKSKKTGCPTNGRNVGAEKLVSGDPDAAKAARKAKKFKG